MVGSLPKVVLPVTKQAWAAARHEMARGVAAQGAASDADALVAPYVEEALAVLAQDSSSLPGRIGSELKAWLSDAPPMFATGGTPRAWIRTVTARTRLKELALALFRGEDIAPDADDVAFFTACASAGEAHSDVDYEPEAIAAFDEALRFILASLRRHLDASNRILLARLEPMLARLQAAAEQPRVAQGTARYLSSRAAHRIPSFTGRTAELDRLVRGDRPSVLAGMPGAGKSSLAREFGRTHAASFRHVLILDASEPEALVQSLVAFARAAFPDLVDAADPHLTAQRARDMLGRGEMRDLVVFDDVCDEQLLAEWMPDDGARIIVTTRQAAWSAAFDLIEVGRWDRRESIAFLTAESGRTDIEASRWDALAEQLGDLPLALSHAAAYLRYSRLADVDGYAAALDRHMASAPRGTDTPRSVFATFSQAIGAAEALLPGAAAVAAVCAYALPVGIPLDWLEGGVLPSGDWMDALAVQERVALLAHLSLVTLDVGDRSLAVHALVQRTARAEDDSAAWVLAVRLVERALRPYAHDRPQLFARLGLHGDAILANRRAWPGGRELGDLAFKIGSWRGDAGRLDVSEALLSKAVALRRAELGPDHPQVAVALVNLGVTLEHMDAFDRAEQCLLEAVAIDETAYGRCHRETAIDLQKLAELQLRLSRFPEAERNAREALAIMTDVSEPDSAAVIAPLQALAGVLSAAGRPEDGLPLVQRALAVTLRHEAAGSPGHAIALTSVAAHLEDLGRLGEAERIWRDALTIFERHLDPDHPRIGMARTALGLCLSTQRRFRRAEPLLRAALEAGERRLGPDHSDVSVMLENVAGLLEESGSRLDEAEALGRRALAIVQRTFPPGHWRFARSANNLALTLLARGRTADAVSLFEAALATDEACFGPDNPSTIIRVENLARAHVRSGRFAEAAALYDRAAEAHLGRNGPDDPRGLEMRRRAARLRG